MTRLIVVVVDRCRALFAPSRLRHIIQGVAALAVVFLLAWFGARIYRGNVRLTQRQARLIADQQKFRETIAAHDEAIASSLSQILLLAQGIESRARASGEKPPFTQEQVVAALRNSGFSQEIVTEAQRRAAVPRQRSSETARPGPAGPPGAAGPPGHSPPASSPPSSPSPPGPPPTSPPRPPPKTPDDGCVLNLRLPVLKACVL